MSKFKRLLSIVLTISLLCTTFLSTGMIAHASMLPLQEEKAYLVVGNHDGVDISAVPLDLILDSLMDSKGNPIVIDENAKVAWCYCKDRDGSTITDDYYLIKEGGTIDLSIYEEYDRYTLEMIVGDGNQLNPDNVRYSVTVYLSDEVSGLRTYELYTQDADGTRHKITPADQYVTSTSESGLTSTNRVFIVPEHVDGTEYYIGINDPIDEHPFVQCDVMDYADYIGFMMGQEYGFEYEYTNLADKFINVDMTKADAGYKNNWNPPEVTEDSYDITKTFALVYKDSASGTPLAMELITFTVTNAMPLFEEDAFDVTTSESVMLTSTSHVSINEIKGPFELTADDITQVRRVFLKEGYSADNEYCYALYADSPIWENANDHVVKATEGFYDTLDAATEATDISDQLLPKSNASGQIGYKANYNIADGGVPVTIFFDDGAVYKFLIVFQDYDKNADLDYVREFTEKPIIGEADPWIRVVGAADSSGNAYDTYVIENGKNLNMDTYYGYGYQTILINDANADLSSIKPEFWYANTERVYAVDENTGDRIDTDHIRDFSAENQQYAGIIIDKSNKQNERNYWVTYKKLNNSGPELFVYGPSAREVILDEYFEFKHDILIANIGNAPLEDISVQLLDAENVKIDSYWTVGGDGNDTLAAFTTTKTNSKYGTLANLAKIRLLPDGDGEVKGTLLITAKGQEPVMITLNGTAQNPEIVTETLDDAVKYVPYQHIIATNNMHDWVETQFSVVEGQLPDGITLNAETGEIYGVPTVPDGTAEQTYTFTVKATFLVDGVEGYFDSATKQFSITVKPNTDENVYLASDSNEGYFILDHVGTEDGQYHYVIDVFADTVFRSNGTYAEFKHLWLNGEKLVEGVDYESEEGSTKITIKGQTFENKTNTDETNTIAMEFRNEDNELNRTSQNFVPKTYPNVDKLITKINALPAANNITLSNKNAVQSARSDYNALSSTEKDKVTNYSKLVACENKIAQLEADQTAANAVIAKINAIPSTINSNARDEISAARTAYNALTSAQKDLVTNLKRLTDAEAALKQYDAQQADKAAAENVETLIRAIPATIDSNAKDEIQAARTAYNALTSTQKGYVSNYSRLTDAESALKTYEEQQAQIAADKAVANTVIAKIDAIPTNLTLNDKDTVNSARTAYSGLTASQKGYVTNYDKLTSAEERIIELEAEAKEQAEINAVISAINEIPDNLTLNDKGKVTAARTAYNALTNIQKEKVVNYSDLTNAEDTIAALEAQENANRADKAAADAVIAKINALPDEITLANKTDVQNARAAYDALTQKQKGLVTNYSDLTDAEAAIKTLEDFDAANKKDQEAAKTVIDLIESLPDNITLEDKDDVVAARNAYDELTDKQKQIVTNYTELIAAEVKIAELEDDNYEEIQSVTFIGILFDKNGNAYADKVIEIHSTVQNGRSDENGSFQFNNVEFGAHTIFVKADDGSIIAQKNFNIKLGSPLSISDTEIIAENGAMFTVRMQLDGDNIQFMNIEEGNKAPVVDTDKDDEGGIDIGEDKTPDDDDDDNGINIGDVDKDDGSSDDGTKPTPDQNVQSPQTGDNSNITLWVILLIVSLFGLCITSKKTFFEKKVR